MPVPLVGVGALVASALFTGAAGYISLCEHPARMQLPPSAALDQWAPSYARALPVQSGLAVVGTVLGLTAWHSSGVGASCFFVWGALALGLNWPFTLLVLMPVNNRLKQLQKQQRLRPRQPPAHNEAEKKSDEPRGADPTVMSLLTDWGRLHALRSGLGLLATAQFAAAILASSG